MFSSTIGGDTAVEITNELVGATDLTSHGNVMAGDLKQAVDIMAIISKKGFLSGNSSMSGEKASSLTQVDKIKCFSFVVLAIWHCAFIEFIPSLMLVPYFSEVTSGFRRQHVDNTLLRNNSHLY